MKTENSFPEHIKDEFPDFIAFLELYYKFMDSAVVNYTSSDDFLISDIITGESSGSIQTINGVDVPNNILFIPNRSNFEIGETFTGSNGGSGVIISIESNPAQTIDQILEIRNPDGESAISYMFDKYRYEFMASLPKKLYFDVNKRNLIKRIRDIYLEKGTVLSFKAIFKVLFNTFLDVKYPAIGMLVPSAGIWKSNYSIMVNLDPGSSNPIPIQRQEIDVTPNPETWTGAAGISDFRIFVTRVRRYTQTKFEIFFTYESLPPDITDTTYVKGYKIESMDSSISGTVISDTIKKHAGKWKNTDGFLSDSNKLQSKYYQKYSYVLQSGIPSKLYNELFMNIGHPAGLLAFTELIISNLLSVNHALRDMKARFLKDFHDAVDTYDDDDKFVFKLIDDPLLLIEDIIIDINKIIEDHMTIIDDPHIDLNPYAINYFSSPDIPTDAYTDTRII